MTRNIASSAAKHQGCLRCSALSQSALAPKPGFWEEKMLGPRLGLEFVSTCGTLGRAGRANMWHLGGGWQGFAQARGPGWLGPIPLSLHGPRRSKKGIAPENLKKEIAISRFMPHLHIPRIHT
jgi:hypothetical protein